MGLCCLKLGLCSSEVLMRQHLLKAGYFTWVTEVGEEHTGLPALEKVLSCAPSDEDTAKVGEIAA